jgi:2-oxo-3-hexenedioate decarboxylase/2-keto-4-pentenoate hydratase
MGEDAAAEALAKARAAGRPWAGFAAGLAPGDEAAAYRMQAGQWRRRFPGTAPAGWKIGCTTPVMQAYLGIEDPCAGRLAAPDIHESPAALAHGDFVRPGVECELAVRLGLDLPPAGAPFDQDSVRPAVAAVMAAIEVVDDRYADFRALDTWTLVADDFFQAAVVLGPPREDWRALDLARMGGRLALDGEPVGSGTGAAVLGHPLAALAWLANNRARFGEPLAAGQVVLTGSIVETRWVAPGSDVRVVLDGLEPAVLRFD